MVKGIGVDIIDIPRIKKVIGNDGKFVEKVFTETEISYCQSKFREEIHYAARFAAWHRVQWHRMRPRMGPATTTTAFPQLQVQRTSLIIGRA